MTHNPQDHLIIGENYLSPSKTFDGQTLPPDQVVPLKFASDLIFLNWVFECRQAGASPASLKYYLMPSVINLETRNVVRKIVGGPLVKKLPAWPGTVSRIRTTRANSQACSARPWALQLESCWRRGNPLSAAIAVLWELGYGQKRAWTTSISKSMARL